MAHSREIVAVTGRSTMKLVRREVLQLAASAIAATGVARVASAQAPAPAPKLSQILRRDLERQGQVVQESVVSVGEFAPGSAAPWHMHPGAQEILHVMEGTLVGEMEGAGPASLKAGESYLFPADVPHLARNEGSTLARALVVHSRSAKDKPLVVVVKR
jgi:quercetin dioxygenase-like cupin family protein